MKVEDSKCYRGQNASKVEKYSSGYCLVQSFLSYKPVVEVREVERYSLLEVLVQSLRVMSHVMVTVLITRIYKRKIFWGSLILRKTSISLINTDLSS